MPTRPSAGPSRSATASSRTPTFCHSSTGQRTIRTRGRELRRRSPGCGLEFAGEAFGSGPADVGGPAEFLEGPDDAGGDVDLSALDAVAGAGGVGVVGVVPGLAHGGDGQRPEVGGLVPRV